ncbi:MAG TPA: hypothetical protein VGF99_15055 [Myxococcota bacterium]
MEGHKIHLNRQTRTLKFRGKDVIDAQAALPGGKSLLIALAVDRDEAAVCIGAAFAMRHEFEATNSKDKAPGPKTISEWLDREPEKYRELELAVLRAAEDHYIGRGKLNRGDLTGEAQPAPPSTSAPSGTDSTDSLAAGG